LALMWRDLIATSVHEELARAEGVKVERVELGFILLIAVMTAIAMKIVGLATGAASDHLDILFGDVLTVSTYDVFAVWIGAGVVLASLALMWRDLIATSVHEELARAEGVKVERVELGFILLIAVMTAIAMKIVGLLLITALMVIPAAAARRMATTPERMAVIAATIAGLSVISGLLASAFIGGASGPCVVLAASCFFALTLFVPQST
ncbi:MAG TPA: metal ABC transporter permease, partial [Aestuariivirga sp.]